MNQFLAGAIALGVWAVGFFFLRFYRKSGDLLFAYMAGGFMLIGVERLGLGFAGADETRHYWYLMRLFGFVLIMVGIFQKNRRRSN